MPSLMDEKDEHKSKSLWDSRTVGTKRRSSKFLEKKKEVTIKRPSIKIASDCTQIAKEDKRQDPLYNSEGIVTMLNNLQFYA